MPNLRTPKVRITTVTGRPIEAGPVRLTPVVRVVTLGQRRGTVGSDYISGWGWAVAWLSPIAVLVEGPEGEERLPIRDETQTALLSIGLGALLFAALLWLIIRATTRAHPATTHQEVL